MATDAEQFGEEVPRIGAASPISSGSARRRRAGAPPDLTRLHRKAQAALAGALAPGEEPRVLVPGLAMSALIATGARVFVFKAGARAGLPFGSRLKEFAYESVMRVDLRRAGEVDVVVIHAPLMISSCSSYWADSRDDPWKARNAVPVGRASAEAERAAEELSGLMAEFRGRATSRRHTGFPGLATDIAALEKGSVRAGIVPVPPEPPGEGEPAPGPTSEDCPRCGNALRAGWQFCPRCGAPAEAGRARRSVQRRRRRT